ncbi:urate oxidase [Kineococcus sp. R8]|uniref:factor-independent urate hydroxylase n=1 Tax=Kineococcus siccus TaxID=2696567 RepID=UPI001411B4F8|nr:urate oxidase [Kineococcus siccus]NAZ83415.1 urate oxidase [Kineococcus siccus]
MGIVLAGHQYGKAENRVVRFHRDTARHHIVDLNVTTTLRGGFAAAYLDGDQAAVLPTDTQKNTAYSYAKEKGLASVEGYALDLARHFVDDVGPVTGARVDVDSYPWDRVVVDGREHDHTWVRSGTEVRTAAVTVDGAGAGQAVHVVAGLKDLVVLKSTGSEFKGFLVDGYTTLPETDDRVMATSLSMAWRYTGAALADGFGFDAAYATVRRTVLGVFATLHSSALQQTLWHMGRAALEAVPEIAELRVSAPNRHHFDYDLARFGVENRGEVFHADDRPYGHVHARVVREEEPDAPLAWETGSLL